MNRLFSKECAKIIYNKKQCYNAVIEMKFGMDCHEK